MPRNRRSRLPSPASLRRLWRATGSRWKPLSPRAVGTPPIAWTGGVTALISRLKPATKGGKKPRGIRNNNPGNIRHSKTIWVGQSEIQSDPDFVCFDAMSFGVRAICRILRAYSSKYHLNTITEVISRWAPPTENNTKAYIASVKKYFPLGYETIDLSNHDDMKDLVMGIIWQENGVYISIKDLDDGIKMGLQ